MEILSVDLAHTAYCNIGIVGLEMNRQGLEVRTLAPAQFGLMGAPSPTQLADALADACERLGVKILLMDGPQGWKDPQNGLTHSRICERILNTPGKTGLPGVTKPANYLAFTTFSVSVFHSLVASGFRLFGGPTSQRLLVESFPLSAWKQLKLLPLPAKGKAKSTDLLRASADLGRLFQVAIPEGLSHDELQALVAAFAGVALVCGDTLGYAPAGAAPTMIEGTWREGFIVNPTRKAIAR